MVIVAVVVVVVVVVVMQNKQLKNVFDKIFLFHILAKKTYL